MKREEKPSQRERKKTTSRAKTITKPRVQQNFFNIKFPSDNVSKKEAAGDSQRLGREGPAQPRVRGGPQRDECHQRKTTTSVEDSARQ